MIIKLFYALNYKKDLLKNHWNWFVLNRTRNIELIEFLEVIQKYANWVSM